MDTKVEVPNENDYPTYFYIHLFFIFIGFIIYIIAFLLFQFYYNYSSLLKSNIFSFIILNSFKSFLEITLSSSLKKEIVIYCIGTLEFYLILSYINKCFTTRKISEDSSNFHIENFFKIILNFAACSFPYKRVFNLSSKFVFLQNTLSIVLTIILFRFINSKLNLILEYLNERKMIDSSIPEIYLPYVKENYYYANFSIINNIFYICLISVICYYGIKNVELFDDWNTMYKYILLFVEESIYISVISAGLIFFYTLNRTKLQRGRGRKPIPKEEGVEETNLAKFSVVDIEIQQDDSKISERKKNKDKDSKEDKDDDEEKENNNDNKINEENETLK